MRLFTVGPVEIRNEIFALREKRASVPYFRTQEFSCMMLELDAILRDLAGAKESARSVYLTASGTAAMEATVLNCFTKEDKILIVDGGTFGHRFVEICETHDIPHYIIKIDYGETLTRERLERIPDDGYTAMLVNHHETSTGQLYDIDMLGEFCKKRNMYLIVDAISSFLCDEIHMEKHGIDAMIISSQKGICVSPGMAMVIISERLIDERIYNNNYKSIYFNFNSYLENFKRGQTPYTPAISVCVEMHENLSWIKNRGLKNHLKYIGDIAEDFRSKVSGLPIDIPTYPLSNAITPIIMRNKNARYVFESLKNSFGIMVNPTGGKLQDSMLRIAHIGNINENDNTYLVDCLKKLI